MDLNKNKKNKSGTQDGNRTRTTDKSHRILSPACLPVPPPGHLLLNKHCAMQ